MKKAAAFLNLILAFIVLVYVVIVTISGSPTLQNLKPVVDFYIPPDRQTSLLFGAGILWFLVVTSSLWIIFKQKPVSDNSKLVQKNQESERLLAKINQSKPTIEADKKKIDILLNENKKIKTQPEKTNSSPAKESNEIDKKFETVQKELYEEKQYNEKLNIELKKSEVKLFNLNSKLTTVENDCKNLRKENQKNITSLENIQAENTKKNEEAISLCSEIEELNQELKSAQANARGGKSGIPPAAYQILYLLQKEGRLIDLLMEDIGGYDDETLGGAIRPIHEGCRKLLNERLILEPVLNEEEGSEITLDQIDSESIKLSGSVPVNGPYTGELIHRGWRLKECNLPELVSGWKGDVVAPAEIEIS